MSEIIKITEKQARDCFLLDRKSIGLWNFQQWECELKKKDNKALAFLEDEKIIGVCVFQITFDLSDLLYIAIHPEFLRRGIGKKLFSEFIKISKKSNIKEIFLEVSVKNIPAIKLYESFDFKTSCVRRKYYKDGSDAFLKTKVIC